MVRMFFLIQNKPFCVTITLFVEFYGFKLMKKIFLVVLGALVIMASDCFAYQINVGYDENELNDAQKFELQMLKRRDDARRNRRKRISGRSSGSSSVAASNQSNSSSSSSMKSSKKGGALYKSSFGSSVSSGMYVK